jgi:hypothetical protein
MPWWVRQRHEHLLRPLPPASHVVLHNGDAAGKAVLVPEPLEDPLGRVPLLLRPALVLGQDAIDDGDDRIQLRPHRRLRAPVTRRHRECHHLRNCSGIDPEPPGCRPLAQSLDPDRVPDLRVKLHVLHPPPSADAAQGFQLPDFYSGATDRIGRFTEGFLLRRLHCWVPGPRWALAAAPRRRSCCRGESSSSNMASAGRASAPIMRTSNRLSSWSTWADKAMMDEAST